ncbi:hypothetical protein [Hyphobacterium sp.]|uniref:hypothetical protein n=1 Tax=Hyphobacterium sp. TaxID=2004662 RepID=UPI0037478D20
MMVSGKIRKQTWWPRSWLPLGRIGPLQEDDSANPSWLVPDGRNILLPLTLFFLVAFLTIPPMAAAIEPTTLYMSFVIFWLASYGLDEFRIVCWSIRRARDIGENPLHIITRRLPVSLAIIFIAVCIISARQLLPFADFDFGEPVTFTLFIASLIGLGLIWFFVSRIYWRRVLRPLNCRLLSTLGRPGPNRYGPAPVSASDA